MMGQRQVDTLLAVAVSDHKAIKDHRGPADQQVVHKAHKGQLVQAGHKVMVVLWDYPVFKVHRDFKVNKDIKE
jgi:hypothetical protein